VTLASELATILDVFALAFVVRLLVADLTDVSYSVVLVLVLAGLGVSALGVQPPLALSHDTITTLLLPILLFRGAVELDHQKLRENLLVPVALVVVVRAITVYGVVDLLNAATDEGVPRSYQHVIVWGRLHTVVPVALVLSLPQDVPSRHDLRVMVFGIAVLGTVVQALLMPLSSRELAWYVDGVNRHYSPHSSSTTGTPRSATSAANAAESVSMASKVL
jgi:NhaP-type Na+/H+ or K+/H+ antiporter